MHAKEFLQKFFVSENSRFVAAKHADIAVVGVGVMFNCNLKCNLVAVEPALSFRLVNQLNKFINHQMDIVEVDLIFQLVVDLSACLADLIPHRLT